MSYQTTQSAQATKSPALLAALLVAASLSLAGCSEELAPQISTLSAEPSCGVLPTSGTNPVVDVTFLMRATGGNMKSEPTGANIPLDVAWDFGDGASATNVSLATHAYSSPGTYTVTVTVEDDDGDKDTRSVEVQVLSIDEALAIDVQVGTPQEARGTEGELLGYDVTYAPTSTYACATSALDAQFSYEWNFGDGSAIERGPAPTHRFPAVGGTFVVNVTATLVNDGNYRTVALPALTIP